MSEIIRVEIDKSLKDVLEKVREEVASDLKKKYKLKEITIYGTLASQILAAKFNGKKCIDFKLRKVGLNKGILEINGHN